MLGLLGILLILRCRISCVSWVGRRVVKGGRGKRKGRGRRMGKGGGSAGNTLGG